jgi:hypothetical protein
VLSRLLRAEFSCDEIMSFVIVKRGGSVGEVRYLMSLCDVSEEGVRA